MNPAARPPCMVTVDLESEWGRPTTTAVERHLPPLLDLLGERGIPATLFCTGDLAQRCPELLRSAPACHELASHGQTHRTFDRLTLPEIRAELRQSKAAVEALGRECLGFRSPNFYMTEEILAETARAGYRYDSSWASFALHTGYKNLFKRKQPVRLSPPGIIEIPIPDATPARIPFGLSYYRAFDPFSRLFHLQTPHLVYLHCDEFLDEHPASEMPAFSRPFWRRNRGERAWVLLRRLLDVLAAKRVQFVTCRQFIESGRV